MVSVEHTRSAARLGDVVRPGFRHQSSRLRMRAMTTGSLLIGALFLYLTRSCFEGPFFQHESNLLAACGLGLLLVGLGALGLVIDPAQRIIADPGARLLTIESLARIGGGARRIPFSAVERVHQKTHSDEGRRSYWAVVVLKSGEEIRVMDSSSDSLEIQGVCNGLGNCIGCPAED